MTLWVRGAPALTMSLAALEEYAGQANINLAVIVDVR